MRFYLTCFALIFSFSCFSSLTINKITQENTGNFRLTVNSPVVINGNVIYIGSDGFLRISDGTLNGDRLLTNEGQPVKASYGGSYSGMIEINNQVLFMNGNDDYKLWKTDGENFSKLSDLYVTYLTKDKGNVVHAGVFSDSGRDLLTTDGETVSIYDLGEEFNFVNELSVCEFDVNNLIIPAYDDNSIKLFRYSNGEVEIATDIINEDNFNGYPEFSLFYAGECYYQYYQEGISKFFKINVSGDVSHILEVEGENHWVKAFEVGGDLFFISNFRKDDYTSDLHLSSNIYKLAAGSVTPELVFGYTGLNGNWITLLETSDNYLYLISRESACPVCSVSSPTPPLLIGVYDHDFNRLRTISNVENISLNVFTINNNDILVLKRLVDKIVTTNEGMDLSSIKAPFTDVINIVGDEDLLIVTGMDRNSEIEGLFKISEEISVSRQMTGLWINDGLQRQGLSIHTGLRPDNTLYMFVSFYIYRNGNPFWVVGNNDINVGGDSISFNLSEFHGESFIPNDQGQATEQIPFGTLTLYPQSCNSITAQVTINNEESIDLVLHRVSDSTNNNICVD